MARLRERDESDLVVHTSKLPQQVVFNILSYLPIMSTAQIGALSRQYHDLWAHTRCLDFGEAFADHMNWEFPEWKYFENIVDKIVQRHVGGEIRTFRLLSDANLDKSLLKNWFTIIRKKGVREVNLKFIEEFEIPIEILDGESAIRVMKLQNCLFLPPYDFNGLRHLTRLKIHRAHVGEIIHIITRNCVFLENLVLRRCSGLSNIIIHSQRQKWLKSIVIWKCNPIHKIDISMPSLTSFHYTGDINEACTIHDVPKLDDLLLDYSNSGIQSVSFQMDMSHVRVLTINNTYMKAFRQKQVQLPNVKEIQFLMNDRYYGNLCDIVMFLKNCPRVERILIDLTYLCQWEYLPSESFTHSLEYLRSVKMEGFEDNSVEWWLVKSFLQNSPMLEMMVLIAHPLRGKNFIQEIEARRPVFDSWRLSNNVNVLAFENSINESALKPAHSRAKWWL